MKPQTRFQRFSEFEDLFDPDENFSSYIIVLLIPETVDELNEPIDCVEDCIQENCLLLGLKIIDVPKNFLSKCPNTTTCNNKIQFSFVIDIFFTEQGINVAKVSIWICISNCFTEEAESGSQSCQLGFHL